MMQPAGSKEIAMKEKLWIVKRLSCGHLGIGSKSRVWCETCGTARRPVAGQRLFVTDRVEIAQAWMKAHNA